MQTFSKNTFLGDAFALISSGIEGNQFAFIQAGIDAYKKFLPELQVIGGDALCRLVQSDFDKRLFKMDLLDRFFGGLLSMPNMSLILSTFSPQATAIFDYLDQDEMSVIALVRSVVRTTDQYQGSLIELGENLAKHDQKKAFELVLDAILERATIEFEETGSLGKHSIIRPLLQIKRTSVFGALLPFEDSTIDVLLKHKQYLIETASLQNLESLSPARLIQLKEAGLHNFPDLAVVPHRSNSMNFDLVFKLRTLGHDCDPRIWISRMFSDPAIGKITVDHLFRDQRTDGPLLASLLPAQASVSAEWVDGLVERICAQLNRENYPKRPHLPEKITVLIGWLMQQDVDFASPAKKILETEFITPAMKALILDNPICLEHSLFVDLGL